MQNVKIGSAPISWDVVPIGGQKTSGLTFDQLLDGMAEAGYGGTELGSPPLFPDDVETLRAELEKRDLQLASSYVPLPLQEEGALDDMFEKVDGVGQKLRQFGVKEIVIAGDIAQPRLAIAGSVAPDGSQGWSDAEWKRAASALEAVAARCQERFGLKAAFHPHAGTYVETPGEVARLMEMTNPDLVGLCFDSGHYVYGGGDAVEAVTQFADRINYLHLKDVWPDKMDKVRNEGIHMFQAWQMDIFAELGRGCIDFPAFFEALRTHGYQGWLIVEQDSVGRSQRDPSWSPVESARQSRDYLRDLLQI